MTSTEWTEEDSINLDVLILRTRKQATPGLRVLVPGAHRRAIVQALRQYMNDGEIARRIGLDCRAINRIAGPRDGGRYVDPDENEWVYRAVLRSTSRGRQGRDRWGKGHDPNSTRSRRHSNAA